MTTSYTPTYNSDGEQVWKPSVGEFYKPASVKRDSFGGIVGALQDLQVVVSGTTKGYPENYAGIIAAIKDLTLATQPGAGSGAGPMPPNFQITVNPDTGVPEYDYSEDPENGDLWFDTRQGRLFVWVDDDWYQTNGADGLPIVTDTNNPPGTEYIVPGQTWWDKQSNLLYIFDGRYSHSDGSIDEIIGTDGVPVWLPVDRPDDGVQQTTTTLPLGNKVKARVVEYPDVLLPEVDITDFEVQADLNLWQLEALATLESEILETQKLPGVVISDTAPTGADIAPGSLWFDGINLDLSIYYEDADSSQWVPVNTTYPVEQIKRDISAAVSVEEVARVSATNQLYSRIENINTNQLSSISALESKTSVLETDLSAAVSAQSLFAEAVQITVLNSRVSSLESAEVDLSEYVTTTSLSAELQDVDDAIAALPYLEQAAIQALIPDISNKVEQADIDQSIANITTEYLPKAGGTLTGSFVIEKEDVSLAAFDVSSSASNSRDLFKLTSFNSANTTATFGATTNLWELAWKFGSEEDFAWIYNDTNKVFSITKEGPACSQLHIGTIAPNSASGRELSANTIEVGERIHKFEQVFADMRSAVVSATDVDTLKSGLIAALTNV